MVQNNFIRVGLCNFLAKHRVDLFIYNSVYFASSFLDILYTIEWAHDDLTKSPTVFDGTTIVHEKALNNTTLAVGQNRPEDVGMHTIEQAHDDVAESPDVITYHKGVLDAEDSNSLNDADPQIQQFDGTELVGISLMVPVGFKDVRVAAIIDSAAQVSVISLEYRDGLGWKTGDWDTHITLRNAQNNSSMGGMLWLWRHVGFRMGGQKYFCYFVEADINDSLILGIDFLRKYSCTLLNTATEIDALLVAREDREKGGPAAELYFCRNQGPPAPPELKVCAVSLDNNEPRISANDAWCKWSGRSPPNVLPISDLGLYVIERSMGVCVPFKFVNVVRMRKSI